MIPAKLADTLRRLTRAFERDDGVRAMFVGGSIATDTADEHSDIDVYLVASDGEYERICRTCPEVLRETGDIVFLRHVDFGFSMEVFIYADGVRGEIGVGRASTLADLHYGPYEVQFDRDGILRDYVFPGWGALVGDRRLEWLVGSLEWYGREALLAQGYLRRGDLWSAAEQLTNLRRRAAALARWRSETDATPRATLDKLGRTAAAADLELLGGCFFHLDTADMTHVLERLCAFAQAIARVEVTDEAARQRLERLARMLGRCGG